MRISPANSARPAAAFTMVEIAICLAIIGIALVGIIGVLPIGMNTQRDTREETILNQDVATLIPVISRGLRGDDDLTNYVYAITNYWVLYDYKGNVVNSNTCGYTYASSSPVSVNPGYYNFPIPLTSPILLTNGANIVGLLSTPEYIADQPNPPKYNYPAVPVITNGFPDYNVYSNHIVAYVHALSGLASEKPPQDNQLMVNDAFTYRMLVVNAPVAMDWSSHDTLYNQQIWKNQRELRLSFFYPVQPNGSVGPNQLTFRTTVAGTLLPTFVNYQLPYLYFYQPDSFGVNTNQ
jgi:type II secretory pathway pseudopilin PulG